MIRGLKRNWLLGVTLPLLTCAVVMTAVGGHTADKENARAKGGRLSLEQLKNMTYKVEGATNDEAPLRNGKFDDKPEEANMACHLEVGFYGPVAHGDLDGDGTPDAAVILWESGGGSGTFISLAVVLNENGTPRHVASADLGDRVKVKSLRIQNRVVTVDMLTQGPDDPMPEPRQHVVRRYALQDAALVAAEDSSSANHESP